MAKMPSGLKMFPAYLRAAGYYTTNNSKEDYNAAKSPDVWDESPSRLPAKVAAHGQFGSRPSRKDRIPSVAESVVQAVALSAVPAASCVSRVSPMPSFNSRLVA